MRVAHESHGTRSSYSYGCRCPMCRKANAKYLREYRRILGKLAGEKPAPVSE